MERDSRSGRGGVGDLDFNPRAPHGARLLGEIAEPQPGHFNPRAPHGARPSAYLRIYDKLAISIHALRMERDKVLLGVLLAFHYFNPRAPHGARLLAFH